MAWPHILSVRLYPPGIPSFCRECKEHNATLWLVSPEGLAICTICRTHGERCIVEYVEKLGQQWSLHDIAHTDKADRTSHARGPICGHGRCSQNFVDHGDNSCIDLQEDATGGNETMPPCQQCGAEFTWRGGPSLECDCGKKVQA